MEVFRFNQRLIKKISHLFDDLGKINDLRRLKDYPFSM